MSRRKARSTEDIRNDLFQLLEESSHLSAYQQHWEGLLTCRSLEQAHAHRTALHTLLGSDEAQQLHNALVDNIILEGSAEDLRAVVEEAQSTAIPMEIVRPKVTQGRRVEDGVRELLVEQNAAVANPQELGMLSSSLITGVGKYLISNLGSRAVGKRSRLIAELQQEGGVVLMAEEQKRVAVVLEADDVVSALAQSTEQ